MNTRKAYIPTADLQYFARNPGKSGMAVFLDKEECAEEYMGRYGEPLSERNRNSVMQKITELDVYFVDDSDFTPEDYLPEPFCSPFVTFCAAYDFESETFKLYTKAAFMQSAMDILMHGYMISHIVCSLPFPGGES